MEGQKREVLKGAFIELFAELFSEPELKETLRTKVIEAIKAASISEAEVRQVIAEAIKREKLTEQLKKISAELNAFFEKAQKIRTAWDYLKSLSKDKESERQFNESFERDSQGCSNRIKTFQAWADSIEEMIDLLGIAGNSDRVITVLEKVFCYVGTDLEHTSHNYLRSMESSTYNLIAVMERKKEGFSSEICGKINEYISFLGIKVLLPEEFISIGNPESVSRHFGASVRFEFAGEFPHCPARSYAISRLGVFNLETKKFAAEMRIIAVGFK